MSGYDLTGQVTLVTGSSRGIGKATAKLFAQRGAKVVINGRDAAAIKETLDALVQIGGEHHGVVADIGDSDKVVQLVKETLECFGRVDSSHISTTLDSLRLSLDE